MSGAPAVELLPLTGHRVADAHARRVVAPPYDALTPDQRVALAAADPDSFLNVLPPAGPDDDDLEGRLVRCRDALRTLLGSRRFVPLPADCMIVLAIGAGPARSVAILGDLEVAAYQDGRVLPHEGVRESRVHQLVRFLDVVGIASSPVAVIHRPHPAVADATTGTLERVPDVAYRGEDGSDVALWVVADPDERDGLVSAVREAGQLYVADGHHRAAAVARFAGEPDGGAAGRRSRVLTAVLASDHLRVLPFHRLLNLPELTAEELLATLHDRGLAVRDLAGPSLPPAPATFTVTLDGRWWLVDARPRRGSGVIEGLDVRLAARELFAPLLGTEVVDGDPRLVPVPGPSGLTSLRRPGHLGVALVPPAVEDVLAVADAGRSMPPKTTYMVPKLRSGLLLTARGDTAPSDLR